jgi:hypothetical protein
MRVRVWEEKKHVVGSVFTNGIQILHSWMELDWVERLVTFWYIYGPRNTAIFWVEVVQIASIKGTSSTRYSVHRRCRVHVRKRKPLDVGYNSYSVVICGRRNIRSYTYHTVKSRFSYNCLVVWRTTISDYTCKRQQN